MSRSATELGPFAWRVTVYDGEYLEHGASLPAVIDIRGDSTLEWNRPPPDDVAQRCLLAVVGGLSIYGNSRYPIQPFTPIRSSMAIFVEQLDSVGSSAGQLIARLDLSTEGHRADGSLLVLNQPRIDVDPVDIKPSDGALDVFVRLMTYIVS